MFKKILSFVMAAALSVTLLASCGEPKEPVAADVPIETLAQAVRDAFGEEYVATMPFDADILEATYGIKKEWVAEFVGEMPMMITHVDTLIIVKPTEGNEENVVKAMEDYREFRINDTMKYPKDIEKINATQIYQEGGYVFFFMLGMLSDDLLFMEGTEEEVSKAQFDAAMANNQKAIDAVNKLFFPEE